MSPEPDAWITEGLDGSNTVERNERFDRIAISSDWTPLFSAETIQEEIDKEINVLERMIKDVENGRDGINETAVRAKREALLGLKHEFSESYSTTNGEEQ